MNLKISEKVPSGRRHFLPTDFNLSKNKEGFDLAAPISNIGRAYSTLKIVEPYL